MTQIDELIPVMEDEKRSSLIETVQDSVVTFQKSIKSNPHVTFTFLLNYLGVLKITTNRFNSFNYNVQNKSSL